MNKGYLELSDDGKIVLHCDQSATGTIAIPDSVTEIGDSAFESCPNLQLVSIPASVGKIGVFFNVPCQLEIDVDSDNPSYCSEDGSLFTKDMKIIIHHCSKNLTEYVVPDTVETIGNWAFEWSDYRNSHP